MTCEERVTKVNENSIEGGTRMRLIVNRDLMLRPIEVQDAAKVLDLILANEHHLKLWLPWIVKPMTIHTILSYIEMSERKRVQQNGCEWVVVYKNEICGIVALQHIDWLNRKATIGYWLGAAYEGKGLVTRSVEAVVRRAFDDLKLNRVEMFCADKNLKSRAIPERLSFRIEGIMRQNEWLYDHFVDHVVYGMIRSDYVNIRKAPVL
jgi:ribosomal-protein-serine acetyltransferase